MEKLLESHNISIPYTHRVSARSKRMRLAVYRNGEVIVTTPKRFSESEVLRFLAEKTAWITTTRKRLLGNKSEAVGTGTREEYLALKEKARTLVMARLSHFSQFHPYTWGSVSIRNQKTRWGSCSKKGNLNFSYKIALLPPELADYIIVHELCHVKEFNHSPEFWNLVSLTLPHYKTLRSELKKKELSVA
jgi:hypothetical protein